MGIEEQSHFFFISQWSNAPTGPTISPVISKVPFIDPSHDAFLGGRDGTTSATGLPKRVIRTGVPVRRTSSTTARHVALNLETAISRMSDLYHSQ
jgi:hypothetical protein